MRFLALPTALVILTAAIGCGPRLHPIVVPLGEESQAKLDRGWNTLLADPSNPDRQLVMDAIAKYALHHVGIDRFWFRSEKRFDRGWVVMTTHYDRADASESVATVDILDKDRMLLKRLTYPATEVVESMNRMGTNLPLKEEGMSAERKAEIEEISRRQRRVQDIFEPKSRE